jgi:hypothetical protein
VAKMFRGVYWAPAGAPWSTNGHRRRDEYHVM